MKERVPTLIKYQEVYKSSKNKILQQWISYDSPSNVLKLHEIDADFFIDKYASGVFDYFMGVIAGEVEIGNCPIMQELLTYLKIREISADELFEICSHFRRSMVNFSYDANLNSKKLYDEISYIFDKNFRGILKFYTDTIFQKLIDARQEALQAGQAKEYFLSNMSHEIRTPLNAILGFVNLLMEDGITQKQRSYLETILDSGENLLSIMNDILDFSKLRSGEFTIEPKIFSIHEELSHTLELFVASANAKEITLTSFIDPSIPVELYGDALRIKQIVSNFLSNAIKFTPQSGHIHLEASCTNKLIRISVKDSGVGIEQDDIKGIFSAFVQAKNSGYAHGGTGLGLSISNQLAELMRGSVDVISTVGEGSTFTVNLPIEVHKEDSLNFVNMPQYQSLSIYMYIKDLESNYKHDSFARYLKHFNVPLSYVSKLGERKCDVLVFVDDECEESFKEELLASEQKAIALTSIEKELYAHYENIVQVTFPLYCDKLEKGFEALFYPQEKLPSKSYGAQKFIGHILVAEDNEANQELIKIILERYGLSFDLAHNGKEAYELFMKNHYDLILMDEQMPVMDGNEAVAKILAFEKKNNQAHTPISALTANVIKGAKERGLLSGYDAFLGKPIVLKELERVFVSYLQFDANSQEQEPKEENRVSIVGLDEEKLKEALMLSSQELVMLLSLFIKKMQTTIPELQNAIVRKDYKQIALLSHNIKGSSGNFRIETIQKSAAEMEKMAKDSVEIYPYKEVCDSIKERIEQIKIL